MRKSKYNKKRKTPGIVVVILLLIVISVVGYYNKNELEAKMLNKQEEITALNAKVDNLKKEQEELKKGKIMSKEEIEKIAREKLGLVYKDEVIFKPDK